MHILLKKIIKLKYSLFFLVIITKNYFYANWTKIYIHIHYTKNFAIFISEYNNKNLLKWRSAPKVHIFTKTYNKISKYIIYNHPLLFSKYFYPNNWKLFLLKNISTLIEVYLLLKNITTENNFYSNYSYFLLKIISTLIEVYLLLKNITTENNFYSNWSIRFTEKYFYWKLFLLKNITTLIGVTFYWKILLLKNISTLIGVTFYWKLFPL